MEKKNVLMLFDYNFTRPRDFDFTSEFKDENCRVYSDVNKALCKMGHNVRCLAVHNDIKIILEEIEENRPDVVFNLADIFNNDAHLDKNIAWVLEMLNLKYTGGTPANLMICNNKALSKKILSYHRIRVPHFQTYLRGHKVYRSKRKLKAPLIIKPLCEEASRGISMASVVDNDDSFVERIKFIHDSMNLDAIAEEYIDGREFYVSILGNRNLKVLPLREMIFGEKSEDEPRVATYKAKWNDDYRKKWGIKNVFAGRISNELEKKIADTCKRAYKALNLKGYARMDIRVTNDNEVYIIEGNVNPSLDREDEFALSCNKASISYQDMVQKILKLAI